MARGTWFLVMLFALSILASTVQTEDREDETGSGSLRKKRAHQIQPYRGTRGGPRRSAARAAAGARPRDAPARDYIRGEPSTDRSWTAWNHSDMRRKGGDGGLRSGGLVPVQRARRDRGRVGALACVLRGKAKARSGVRRSGAVGEDVCGTLKPLPKEKVGATVAAEAEQRRVRVRCGGGTRVGAPGEARLQSASSRPSAGCAPPWQPAPWSRRSRTPRATPDTLTGGYLAEARRSAGRARAPCCHQQPTRRSRRALRAGRAKRGERQGREARVPLSRPPDERTAPAIFLETPARAAMASTRSPLDTAIRTELRAATWPPHARGAGRKASAHERSAQSTVANLTMEIGRGGSPRVATARAPLFFERDCFFLRFACLPGAAASASIRLKECARCHELEYCSVGCQKSDWKAHKKIGGKGPRAGQ